MASGGGLRLRSDNLASVGELYTEDNFRQLVVAIEATPAFLGGFGGLKIIASAVLFERHPLERTCAVADRCERTFDDVGNRYEICGADVQLPF
jgi:hypothetical protein